MRIPARRLALASLLSLPLCAAPAAAQRGGPPDPNQPVATQPFRWEFLGPASGGRVASIAGVPGDTSTWYLGNASGGVWKSTDGGASFRPVSDAMPVQAIGALAVAPTDRNTIWAGTGEAWAIRESDVTGDGVYKSADAGATWTNVGGPLRESGRVARILVHPADANVVWVCALGRITGPQEERGVYKTTDGGKTWTRSLFVDRNTGCSSLAMDAKDPNVLFAGTWQVDMKTWAMTSGGPGSGVFVTRDGGARWQRVQHPGLPKSGIGKVGVAIAPTNSNRVYALLQTYDQGSLWRSDDGGRAWKVVSWARGLIGRAGYYMHIAVSSGDPDDVYVANSSMWRSTDGGLTFSEVNWGGDNHDIWVSPVNPDHMGITHDLGATLSTDRMRTPRRIAIANGQMYHVAVDDRAPYWVYSNRQDNGTMRGPSDGVEQGTAGLPTFGRGGGAAAAARRDSAAAGARRDGAVARGTGGGESAVDTLGPPVSMFDFPAQLGNPSRAWDHGIGGCESGFTIPDPSDDDVVWGTCYGNKVTRYDHATRTARSVAPWRITLDAPPTDVKYRCHWTAPLAIDPFDPKTVYYGCQVIFRTDNQGQSWSVISPDLSRQDPTKTVPSGGVIQDNLGQFYGQVVFAIAPSTLQRGLIWAGTNDGQVWLTRDGGGAWTNVTRNIAGLPPLGTVRKIEPSRFDAGTAYIAVDFHTVDDRKPYVYKTTDFGRTWASVTGDLPSAHPLDYVLAVAENPNRKGMLFAGTGHGFYYSTDDGKHWTQLQDGLPAAPVTWIEVPKRWHDVVVSTYGRGLWVLRDIAPIEGEPSVAGGVRLWAPRPGVRQARSGRADVTFRLPSAGRVQLEFLDGAGAVVRRMQVNGRAGVNRASWNLRYDLATPVELRTAAPDNPHIWDEPRFRGRTTRPIAHWGIQQPQTEGPIAAPGRHAVRLTAADGATVTQPFEVVKDPRIPSPDADLVASTALQVRIRDRMTETATLVNRVEVMRKQLEDQLKSSGGKGNVAEAIRALDRKLLDVELKLLSRHDLHSDDKWFVEAYRPYLNLLWLAGEVGTGAGDVAGGAEYRPTDTSVRTFRELEQEIDAAKAAFEKVLREDVPAFQRQVGNAVTVVLDE